VISLLRALGRLVAFLLLVVLALAGLAVLVAAIAGAPAAADTAGLPVVRDAVAGFLGSIEDRDVPLALASLGVALLCLLLALGTAAREREPLVPLREQPEEGGRLAARKRAVRQMAQVSTARVRGLTRLKLRVKPRRRATGGTLGAMAVTRPDGDVQSVSDRLAEELRPVAEPFGLTASVRAKRAERGPA
jgi:hypothetical protein